VTLVALRAEGNYLNLVSKKVTIVNLKARGRYAVMRLRNVILGIQPHVIMPVMRELNIIASISTLGLNICLIMREANTLDAILAKPFLGRKFYLALMRLAYRRARMVVCNSEDTRSDLVINRICKNEKSTVIGNPVIYGFNELLTVSHPWFNA